MDPQVLILNKFPDSQLKKILFHARLLRID